MTSSCVVRVARQLSFRATRTPAGASPPMHLRTTLLQHPPIMPQPASAAARTTTCCCTSGHSPTIPAARASWCRDATMLRFAVMRSALPRASVHPASLRATHALRLHATLYLFAQRVCLLHVCPRPLSCLRPPHVSPLSAAFLPGLNPLNDSARLLACPPCPTAAGFSPLL